MITEAMREQDIGDLYSALQGLRVRVDDLVEQLDWERTRREQLEHTASVVLSAWSHMLASWKLADPELTAAMNLLEQALNGPAEPAPASLKGDWRPWFAAPPDPRHHRMIEVRKDDGSNDVGAVWDLLRLHPATNISGLWWRPAALPSP